MTLYTQLQPITTSNRDWFNDIGSSVISWNADRIIVANTDGSRTYLWSALIFGNLSYNSGANTMSGTINWITRTDASGNEFEAAGDVANNLGVAAAGFWTSSDKFGIVFGGDDEMRGYSAGGSTAGSVFDGGPGADIMRGYGGSDYADYRNYFGGLTVDMENTGLNTGYAAGDVYDSVENILGSLAGSNDLSGDGAGNILTGSSFTDVLRGRGGGDRLEGGLGVDLLEGGEGGDTLLGGDGSDRLLGGLGSDIISGSDLAGTLTLGDDDLASYADHTTGVNIQLFVGGDGTVTGAGGEFDQLIRIYDVEGSQGDDVINVNYPDGNTRSLWGLGGNDTITGGYGDNWISGGAGSDILSGSGGLGDDSDTVSFADLAQGVTVTMNGFNPGQAISGADVDSIQWFENVEGSAFADSIRGDGAKNRLYGGGDGDYLNGGGWDDEIFGGGGDDVLSVEGGIWEVVNGGAGSDTVFFENMVNQVWVTLDESGSGRFITSGRNVFYTSVENITGGNDNDIITGNSGANVLSGGLGGDLLNGAGGGDLLKGEQGDDRLTGGAGDDTLDGGGGTDTADYSGAASGVTVSLSNPGPQDTIGAGLDTLASIENLVGSAQLFTGDRLTGNGAANRIEGLAGNDVISGMGGGDTMTGGEGDDRFLFVETGTVGASVDGGLGHDTLVMEGGGLHDFRGLAIGSVEALDFDAGAFGPGKRALFAIDQVGAALAANLALRGDTFGASGAVFDFSSAGGVADLSQFTFTAWASDDSVAINGSDQACTITGTSVNDVFEMGEGTDVVRGGAGHDQANGAGGVDMLDGGAGEDILYGGNADDSLTGGAGGDVLNGGAGSDTASYAGAAARVKVALDNSIVFEGDAIGDTFSSIARLIGTGSGDVLIGDLNGNIINGGSSNDTIRGKDGGDILRGDKGGDNLGGGLGDDKFSFLALSHGGDTVIDFSNLVGNNDSFQFKGSAFGGLAAGALAANRFLASTTGLATNTTQRFIYETDTGVLRYDSNGSTAGGVTVLATLTGAPALTSADIVIL